MKSFKLYDIDQQIEDVLGYLVNEETGEINPIAEAELEALEKEREVKIVNCGLFIKNAEAYIASVKEEESKLRDRRKVFEKRVDWLKRYLEAHLPPGEKIDLANLRISWRKSEAVEVDDTADLQTINFSNPELVELTLSLKKREMKEYIKTTGVSFQGIRLVEKQNIQIK